MTTVKRYVKRFWEEAYHDKAEEQPSIAEQTSQQTSFEANRSHQLSNLQQFLHPPDFYTQHQTTAARDEYQEYIKAPPLPCDDPLQWWGARRKEFPILSQMALDLLSIPLMSAECERVFSSAKNLVTDNRNTLKEEVIEASTLLRHWLKEEGII